MSFTAKIKSRVASIIIRLFQPVDNTPLIVFRICFGLLLACQALAELTDGTVYDNFVRPPFTFTYIGLEWMQLPGIVVYIFFFSMVVFGLLVMIGAYYRIAMTGYALLWTIIYLVQKAGYNNHYYLLVLLCWIMVFMPANRSWAYDVKRKAVIQSGSCPYYTIWLFIAQLAIVYFYAALSKLTSTWFSGKFIAIQFSRLSANHITGILYGQKWFQLFICYGGFLFDLGIVPLLLFRPTRNVAFMIAVLFHVFNSYSFKIGIFPYLAIALNVFFADPALLRRIFFNADHRLMTEHSHEPTVILNKGLKQATTPSYPVSLKERVILTVLSIYLCAQLLIPLRSLLFKGNVFWTEEGYRLSWKMMMRAKSGKVFFKVIDPATGHTWIDDPGKRFTPLQVTAIAVSPDITWQYAQQLSKEYAAEGMGNVEVYAIGAVSLNRSKPAPLVDTSTDLTKVKWEPFSHSPWIKEEVK